MTTRYQYCKCGQWWHWVEKGAMSDYWKEKRWKRHDALFCSEIIRVSGRSKVIVTKE